VTVLDAVDPEFFTTRRTVVTGGNGFLGSHIVELLRGSGADVTPLGSSDYNLTEQTDVRALFADLEPQLVVHAAGAIGGIGANVANPGRFLYANALMGLMVLEEARLAGVEKLVMISTTCTYPEHASLPFSEGSLWDGKPAGATGPYGVAKRMLHEAAAGYQRQYGFTSCVLMMSNLYGPGDHFDEESSHVLAALVRRFVEAAGSGAPSVTNWGTGTPTREFLHVRDAARAVALAASRWDDPAPVNVGTGVETSIRELAELVAAAAGYSGEILWDPTKPDGQPRRFLAVDRARAFGFDAGIPLATGIEETVAWYRANH
jgi:GDP-L-fucose synthase